MVATDLTVEGAVAAVVADPVEAVASAEVVSDLEAEKPRAQPSNDLLRHCILNDTAYLLFSLTVQCVKYGMDAAGVAII